MHMWLLACLMHIHLCIACTAAVLRYPNSTATNGPFYWRTVCLSGCMICAATRSYYPVLCEHRFREAGSAEAPWLS